jgi:hypothetical protein
MATLDEKIDRVDQRIARQENAIERRGQTKAQVPVQDGRHRILKIRSIVRFPWSITRCTEPRLARLRQFLDHPPRYPPYPVITPRISQSTRAGDWVASIVWISFGP